jgi:hypothetical protein
MMLNGTGWRNKVADRPNDRHACFVGSSAIVGLPVTLWSLLKCHYVISFAAA